MKRTHIRQRGGQLIAQAAYPGSGSDNLPKPSPLHQLLAADGPIVTTICAHFPNVIAIYAFGS